MEPDIQKEEQELQQVLAERFKHLPKPVQNAITSADIEKNLQGMAARYKLHLDQWELLENEVKLTLYGFQEAEKLEQNIKSEVGVDTATAASLASDISKSVFEPIREELERELAHPEAKATTVSAVEAARTQVIASETTQAPAPVVQPSTPPAQPPAEKAVRAPVSQSYQLGVPSTQRAAIADDPYREPPA